MTWAAITAELSALGYRQVVIESGREVWVNAAGHRAEIVGRGGRWEYRVGPEGK